MGKQKPIPRAVLVERLRILEDKRDRRRLLAVRFGVYIVLVVGVLASQALLMSDDIRASLQPIELGQIGGAAILGIVGYNKLETSSKHREKDILGMAKKGNVGRVLRTAFAYGFTLMSVLGGWW